MHNLFHRRSKIEENPEKFWRELITKNETLKGRMFKWRYEIPTLCNIQ